MAADTTAARLLELAQSQPESCAYQFKQEGRWQPVPWRRYAEQVEAAARALIALGVGTGLPGRPGSAQAPSEASGAVAILGFNRPEWTITDLAAAMAGGVPVGLYTTSSPEEVAYILNHSEAPGILVEDTDQLAKVLDRAAELPHLRFAVLMEGVEIPPEAVDAPFRVLSWQAFQKQAEATPRDELLRRHEAVQEEDLATLIYTSGTTGPPKAVMLTHKNVSWTADAAFRNLFKVDHRDSSLSYLPLSHIAEKMFSIHGSVATGYQVLFAESLEAVPANLAETQPTIVFGVPRVWEKLHAAVAAKLEVATGFKAKVAAWATGVGRRTSALRCRGEEPPFGLAFQHRLADRLFFSKVKPLLGLSRVRIAISGAAPISSEVLEFLSGLDVILQEVYGQSEGCGPTSFNAEGQTRFGTVGPAIPGVEVKIADDGEILVRGENVFPGYYKDPDATAETIRDGWLCSGDLGTVSDDGFLTVTGRKKEILITAGGKNISPANLEAALKKIPLVADAVVVGDRRKFLAALVTLEPEAAREFAAEQSLEDELDAGTLHASPAVREALDTAIRDQVNPRFARVQQVRAFTVLPGNFSVDTGELTPTMKLKRRVIDERYAEEIESLYRVESDGA